MPMWLWPMIGNDCCLGVESGDFATAVAGACETVGWMVRLLDYRFFFWKEEICIIPEDRPFREAISKARRPAISRKFFLSFFLPSTHDNLGGRKARDED
jgi:hypothetical protein